MRLPIDFLVLLGFLHTHERNELSHLRTLLDSEQTRGVASVNALDSDGRRVEQRVHRSQFGPLQGPSPSGLASNMAPIDLLDRGNAIQLQPLTTDDCLHAEDCLSSLLGLPLNAPLLADFTASENDVDFLFAGRCAILLVDHAHTIVRHDFVQTEFILYPYIFSSPRPALLFPAQVGHRSEVHNGHHENTKFERGLDFVEHMFMLVAIPCDLEFLNILLRLLLHFPGLLNHLTLSIFSRDDVLPTFVCAIFHFRHNLSDRADLILSCADHAIFLNGGDFAQHSELRLSFPEVPTLQHPIKNIIHYFLRDGERTQPGMPCFQSLTGIVCPHKQRIAM
mmetsp:Transcript_20509/g.34322  ORF Transcript_20509/g.34322 Transcript_20509/m.34322 type:complete len:336 (+) Transcript_20509:501-1508(+)